jgi:hypothetical protein
MLTKNIGGVWQDHGKMVLGDKWDILPLKEAVLINVTLQDCRPAAGSRREKTIAFVIYEDVKWNSGGITISNVSGAGEFDWCG